jgi:hypothetical protein
MRIWQRKAGNVLFTVSIVAGLAFGAVTAASGNELGDPLCQYSPGTCPAMQTPCMVNCAQVGTGVCEEYQGPYGGSGCSCNCNLDT